MEVSDEELKQQYSIGNRRFDDIVLCRTLPPLPPGAIYDDPDPAELPYVNLSGASFRNAYLPSANLQGAVLSNTDFSGANMPFTTLSGADLRGAKLWSTDLTGSDLSDADLRGAVLSEAILSCRLHRANLGGADLTCARIGIGMATKGSGRSRNRIHISVYLHSADLTNANLEDAIIGGTLFAGVDLSRCLSLERAKHIERSTVGADTLRATADGLTEDFSTNKRAVESFLRSCGVEEVTLEHFRMLLSKPIKFHSCFISYSHNDEAFAKQLYNDLQENGIRCWYAPDDLRIGDKLRPTIDQSIMFHDKLLLILSKHSVKSSWVENEVHSILEQEEVRGETCLLPIRLDDAVMDKSLIGWAAQIRRSRLIGDFCAWENNDAYQMSFERLLRDLKTDG